MLEIVYGDRNNPQAALALVSAIESYAEKTNLEGTLYLGYPIIPLDGSSTTVDAVLTTKQHGLVIFDFKSANMAPDEIYERQLDIETSFKVRLLENRALRKRTDLAFAINVIS